MGTALIQPEDGGCAARAGAFDCQLDPIADRGVLRLARAPDITRLHLVFGEDASRRIGHANGAMARDFEGLVVRTVFFCLLRHEPDIGHGTHLDRIERAIGAAEIDDGLVNRGISAVRNDGQSILRLTLGVPHLAAFADHGRHRCVDDHIAGHMEVGDAFVRIDHGQRGSGGERRSQSGLEPRFFRGGQLSHFGHEVAESVVEIDAELVERRGLRADEVPQKNLNRVAEEHGVGDLHHGCLEME